MTTSPSFLESNSDDYFDIFALTFLFENNEGSNQDNNTSQANFQYSVDPIPPLKLQVNNFDIFERKILVEGIMKSNFLIGSGSTVNIIKKATRKLHLKTTKIKIVPYGQSENCLKIEEICYLTLETSSKFATDKFYVVNTKIKNLLASSCAITLNLLSLNTQSKTQCEINLRILTGKKQPKIKLQRLQKIRIWTFGSLVHQINSF